MSIKFRNVECITYYTLVMASADSTNVNQIVAREYVMSMAPIALPSGGVFGGKYSYNRTGDYVKSSQSRIQYINTHFSRVAIGYGYAYNRNVGTMQCDTHGVVTASLGHIFPRSFGGIFHPSCSDNIALQCIDCNKLNGALIAQIDVEWLQSHVVNINYYV